MSCPPLETVERYASSALDEVQRAAVAAHLSDCELCRRQLAEIQENMLVAAQIARARVEAEVPGGTQTTEDLTLPPPRPQLELAGYEIVRELHRGGQGVVYQAVQRSTKRKVAVKVLLEGPFASASTKKRFEREIDLVAQLKHPNIITIFDSGTTSDGRLFFAMDYVRGLPLHQYVRENKLTLEQTLKLFGQVCAAVQYAHQKGVIHRDLKPSNILVDHEGVPRVLDFGLAKQMAAPIETIMSMTGQVIGTLPYMSPEQARGNPDEIDTRTDVYALGVILYELLTGHYPYAVVGNIDDVMRNIKETAPTPPSRAWQPGTGVASRRDRRGRQNDCPIDNEVQTIVLKALSKERERRYRSAGELGDDIAHYLAGEPIEAKRDSVGYVLRKGIARNKRVIVVALAFIVVATVGLVASLSLRSQAAAQRERAVTAERQKAMDDALMAAMSGNFPAAESAIQRAELLGTSTGWIRALRGQVALHLGHPREAVEHLEQAVRLLPDSVAAKAMLPVAYEQSGQLDRAIASLHQWDLSRPVTAEDFLFKGQAEVYDHAPHALATLDEAIRRRDSVFARTIRAEARHDRAIGTGDPRDVELALQDAMVAKAMLPDNPVVRITDLHCQIVAADVYGDRQDQVRRSAALSAAEDDVRALEIFPLLPRARRARALYFEHVGDDETALAELRAGSAAPQGADITLTSASVLYGRGASEEALAVLDRVDPAEHDVVYHTLHGYVLSDLDDDTTGALAAYRAGTAENARGYAPIYPHTILKLLGRNHEAVAAARKIREHYFEQMSPWLVEWYRNVLDYNCGDLDAEHLLRAAGDSRWNQCEAHFFIGLTLVGEGDRAGAAQHFRASCETHAWPYLEYRWSKSFLNRLERDPRWPPWIPADESRARN